NQYRRGRSYGRADNPSYDQPEALITALEGGAASLLFASGMAAAAAVFDSAPPGSHVVAPLVMYWGLRRRLAAAAETGALAVDFGTRIAGAGSRGGAFLGSFEAFLLLRGMRTLYPRVERACRSAQQIAEALAGSPQIQEVLYPGLPTHPGHAVAARQMQG